MTLLEITVPLAFFLAMISGIVAFVASISNHRKTFFFFMILGAILVLYGNFIDIKFIQKSKQEVQSAQTIDANIP